MSLTDDLSDLEKKILAEGEKVLAAARKGALELRKSKLVAELEKIEDDLVALVQGKPAESTPEAAPESVVPEPSADPEPATEAPEEGAPEPTATPSKTTRSTKASR